MNALRTALSRSRLPLLRSSAVITAKPITAAHRRPFASTTPAATATAAMSKLSADTVLEHVRNRRTYYGLTKSLGDLTPARVEEIVKESLKHVPSSFNSQSNRVVVLFGAHHDKLWDLTAETLRAIVPAEQWPSTEQRIAGFKAGAASVLFFEDDAVVRHMQEQFAIYADRFAPWAGHSSAMLQLVVWTALEAEGLGANLQHYNPLIDDKVRKEWEVPETWRLTAQLVVGARNGGPGAPGQEKTFKPFSETYKSYGA
ncbi:uncharacterized protein E0L32_009815 [Thyridium curvatum]|uniref:Nitroreductase domain-containing protein n=1 Tax=Thyridium curvatum TaxID=1093900 RepID=A0A507AM88_9PEZI|nr:uncharacterized protein E0L32_009815 [Thyridium curvatum]TPX08753.1 hypothetical protein E0L32_009815 [Thyridium curvatum]